MQFTITTLAENSVPQGAAGLIGEHGQSFYIKTGDRHLLFDTGQGLSLLNNASKLGVELESIDTVVLSHGHDDHSGGLRALAGRTTGFALLAHPEAFSDKFVRSAGGALVSRSIPVNCRWLRERGIQVRLETESVEIAPGVFTTGEIPFQNDFESIEDGFFTLKDGETVPDSLPDDQALILESNRGLVVLLGCTHRGLINTLHHVRRLTGKEKIHAVLGGLHLGKAPDEKIRLIMDALRGFDVERIGVGHCTGMRAVHRLMEEFGARIFFNGVGEILRI